MRDGQFAISPELLAKVQNYISNSSALPDDMRDELRTDPSSDSARYRFTRNLALYVSLRQLDSQTRFAEDYPEEAAAFEKIMTSYFAQSAGFFALTRHIPPQLEPLPQPIRDARDGYKSLCYDLYEAIRLMLARVILYSSNGQHEVGRQLARLGFAIESEQEMRISANVLVLNAIGVVALFVLATVLAAGSGVTTGSALVIGCVVAVNHSIAACSPSCPNSSGRSPISVVPPNGRLSPTQFPHCARSLYACRSCLAFGCFAPSCRCRRSPSPHNASGCCFPLPWPRYWPLNATIMPQRIGSQRGCVG